MTQLAKLLIISGAVIMLAGIVLYFSDKVPWLGKLPGDIIIKKKNYTFYFPVVTSILLSLLLSMILYIIFRLRQ